MTLLIKNSITPHKAQYIDVNELQYFDKRLFMMKTLCYVSTSYRVSHNEMVIYRRRKRAQSSLFSEITGSYFQENLWNFWYVNFFFAKKSRGGLISTSKNGKKIEIFFFKFSSLKLIFRSIWSKKWKKNFFKKSSFFSINRVPPLDWKKKVEKFSSIFFFKSLFWVNISYF